MDFKTASAFVMPFGQYKGRTIDAIATKDEGLLYLDWLRGERTGGKEPVDLAIATYLDDESVADDLARLVEERGER